MELPVFVGLVISLVGKANTVPAPALSSLEWEYTTPPTGKGAACILFIYSVSRF